MAPSVSVLGVQPLLQGFGTRANTYYIRVAKNNVQAAQESFRSQLLDLAANVLNLYWNLVSASESVQAAQQSLEIAQKFDDDTRQRVRLGVLAGYQTARADAQLARQRQALALAQMQEQQSEQPLKDAISRVEEPLLEQARIVPLDRIEVPATDDLPPLRELVAKAMAGRPDLAVARINDENAAITSVGTTNNLLPTGVALRPRHRMAATRAALGSAFGAGGPPRLSQPVRRRVPFGPAQQPVGAERLRDRPTAVAAERAPLAENPE